MIISITFNSRNGNVTVSPEEAARLIACGKAPYFSHLSGVWRDERGDFVTSPFWSATREMFYFSASSGSVLFSCKLPDDSSAIFEVRKSV